MKCLWCDTETTGLKTEDSAPFQIAMIFSKIYKHDGKTQRLVVDKVFYLNPLNDLITYHEEAGKVHGYSEVKIRSFESPQKVIPEIIKFLQLCINDFDKDPEDKSLPYFIGYNVKFDYEHLVKLFSDYGFNFTEYFQPKIIDVFQQVKNASYMRVLPRLENLKQTTVAKALGVDLTNAHDALADINATREIATILQKNRVNLF